MTTSLSILPEAFREGFRAGWHGEKFPADREGDRDYTTGYVIGRDRKAKQ